ncbi:MAG TPA: CPBP family glutamic-type intramembrane protease [Bacilli bacterium]|nr:CPBP family glutamic-type intramembrane protease [Bacilli bacterium]
MNINDPKQPYEVYDEIPSNNTPTNGEELFDENYDKTPNPKTPLWQDFVLIILAFAGLDLVVITMTTIISTVMAAQGHGQLAIDGYLSSYNFLSIANFTRYGLIFLIMVGVLYLSKTLLPIVKSFKKFRTYLYGIGYGFIVILISIVYNNIIGMIVPDYGSNENQNAVESVIKLYPLLSVIWIPFLGPIVEELGYRLGLFNTLKKINRPIAYIVTSLIFGLIHFNLPVSGDTDYWAKFGIEILNLPGYIISGLAFNYIYDKENIATSTVAHITNNLVSYIVTIIAMSA